ncbi:MAG: hypothetical protein ACREVW_03605, partial [Burkholderiales bacterium]
MTVSRLATAHAGAGTLSIPIVPVSAQEHGSRMEAHFKAADKDNDGSLTREEAKAMPRVAKNFDAIDADKSGTVTGKEIHDYMKAHCEERKKNWAPRLR